MKNISGSSSSSDHPTVSIVIPCYNGAPYLEGTLESALSQTIPPDEILFIDDGSTDGSGEIARRFPIRCHSNGKNLGLAATRNLALQLAHGEVILFLDVDARADGQLVELLRAELAESDIVAVGGQGIEVNIQNEYDEFRKRFFSQSLGSRRLDPAPVLFGLCSAYRRDALSRIGGFDPEFRTNGEDFDLSFRLKAAGSRLVYNPELKVYHHRHDDRESLLALVHRWFYWGGRAYQKNGRAYVIPFVAKIVWDALRQIGYALFVKRGWSSARIAMQIVNLRLSAIRDLWRPCPGNNLGST